MTSKTFESIDQTRQLHVKPLDKHVTLVINYKDAGRSGLTISHSDAPALALAILEAAGVAESSDAGVAANYLRLHISEQERATAEAKEQAELEAEALELRNEFTGQTATEWAYPTTTAKEGWLAVARRAREMREEK